MRVEALQRWRGFRAGRFYDPPDGVANLLIRRGIVRPVAADSGADEPAPKPKRGRPAKRRG